MATASRALWKGAISFGLVHIPVSLHAASREGGIDFDWLDRRTHDPVGYQRINKRTGRKIDKEQVVRGVQWRDGEYVVLSDDEIADAYPRSTQSIDIESFVTADEIPFVYLDRPYYLAPTGKGDKVYALLRETLLRAGKVGLARVIIASKQHLAVLVASGPALVLNLLRWGDEVRTWEALKLPPEGAQGLQERELSMAAQLVEELSGHFDPAAYRDAFRDDVMALVERKAEQGETAAVEPVAPAARSAGGGAEVIDLSDLLRRSLKGGRRPEDHGDGDGDGDGGGDDAVAGKTPTKTPRKTTGKTTGKTAKAEGRAAHPSAAKKRSHKTPAKTSAKTSAKAPADSARRSAA